MRSKQWNIAAIYKSIAAIYRKYGKCEYIKYSTSVGNNGMQAYNKEEFNNTVYMQRKHIDLDNI
jgi:hypothetical protein